MKIGVLMYTYNRTDDARINMEIIRNVWSKNDLLKDVTIVHSYNGEKAWWLDKYLEDELLYLANPGHFKGAEILMDEGIKCFEEKYPDVDYIIILACDTWLVKPEYLENLLMAMQKEQKLFATCTWSDKDHTDIWRYGMAMDFCIFDAKWLKKSKMFPMGFSDFAEKYKDLFFYQGEDFFIERVIPMRFKQAIERTFTLPSENLLYRVAYDSLYIMKEREPVHVKHGPGLFGKAHTDRTMYWPNMGLLTHHEPEPKKKILKKLNLKEGEEIKRLVTSSDLSYYNRGHKKTAFIKGDKKIGYGD
jgi:hypothetical protein